MKLEKLIAVARGEQPADAVLKNGRVVNVFSNEILPADVALYEDRIAGIGEYSGLKEIDLKGGIVSPGFIDGHVHLESAMVTIPEFARCVVPRGTTTVVTDTHEIANVLGMEGILYMLKSSKYNPLSVYVMLPSCVPATHLETAGAELKAVDLLPLLDNPWVLGMGEMMSYAGVIHREEPVMDKLKIVPPFKQIDGHAPSVLGKDLAAYVAAGVRSDHESTTIEEAREKLRLGMYVMIREGSATRDLRNLLPLVTTENAHRFFFVTDDRTPKDLIEEGHIDFMINTAIREGLDPVLAIRLATLHAATYFGLKNLGAVAPGYLADLAIIDNWEDFNVTMVFKNGELVAREGQLIYSAPQPAKVPLRNTINVAWLHEEDFRIPAKDGKACRVIGLIPDQIVTDAFIEQPLVSDGFVEADTTRDLLKLAVIDRHTASGAIGRGLVRGFGLKKGALASSVAHDSHNIIVVGTNDKDMLAAVVQIIKNGGGIAIAADGAVVEHLPLPIAGLMSDKDMGFVSEKLRSLRKKAEELGVTAKEPFMSLSFLALAVIPKLKLTDQGLVDVEKFELVDLFV